MAVSAKKKTAAKKPKAKAKAKESKPEAKATVNPEVILMEMASRGAELGWGMMVPEDGGAYHGVVFGTYEFCSYVAEALGLDIAEDPQG